MTVPVLPNDVTTETDLLIIGGGSAGLWAANHFKELHPSRSVLIVDKGPQDWGGLMTMAGGDFEAVLLHENIDDWINDFIYYFDGLCDQEELESVLRISVDRLRDYQSYGCEFLTTPDGALKSVPQRGLSHVKLYPARIKGRGGENMVQGLVKRMEAQGVRRLGRVQVTDLLMQDGRTAGATGFDAVTGAHHVLRAQVVLAAWGVGGWKTSYGKNTPTGEGVDMAWRAGATMRDFEFARVWNMPRHFGWEGQTTLLPLGARFVNALGEPFMEHYSPVLGANTDPHFTTIAMAMEIRAGRGPISFDVSRIKPEDLALLKPQTGWQALNYDKLRALGMDLFRDNTEWVPQMTISHGGLDADVYGRTSVPGLFAAGTARSTEPGVYAGGFALMTTSATGYLAAEGVAEYLDNTPTITRFPDTDPAVRKALYRPLGIAGLAPKTVLTEIQTIMFPYDVSILKTEAALQRALTAMETIRDQRLPAMAASDPHALMKLREVLGVALVSELYLRASLERRETRAGHYREDCLQRNPTMLAWQTLRRGEDGAVQHGWKPVPLDRYRFPVTNFYQDNFTFSTPKQ